jgi:tRNA 2-selenouridine synthase
MDLVDIDRFLELKNEIPHIDVRSPIEYDHAHIPGCVNIPLFTDDERARIGWTYKHEGQEAATILGESFAEPKIPYYLKTAESISSDKRILVLCARGGLRSLRFAKLLEDAGFEVYRLKGGYKSYRKSVLTFYEKDLSIVILSGRTGCGKTEILKSLAESGEQVLDLEALAHHRGSAFGSIGMESQPSTEYFQNRLSEEIRAFNMEKRIWVEDESLNIGKVLLPANLYEQMSRAPQVLVAMDRESRIDRLCDEYGQLGNNPLIEAIEKIHMRLGDENYRKALNALDNGNLKETASIALGYYDKCYDYSLSKKNRDTLGEIQFNDGDTVKAADIIRSFHTTVLTAE